MNLRAAELMQNAGPWGGTVIKYVAQMGICLSASHLGPYHEQAFVGLFHYVLLFQGSGETRPARTRVELIQRAEQGLTRNNVHIDARCLVVPIFIPERWFCSVLLSHLILHRRQSAL